MNKSSFESKLKQNTYFKNCNLCRERIRECANKYKEQRKQYYQDHKVQMQQQQKEYRCNSWDKRLLYNCKKTDKQLNRPFDLDKEWIKVMLQYQHSMCCICGDKMLLGNGNKDPKQISIDRIDNSLGHIKTNCTLVCWKCNFNKRGISYEEFNCDPECIPRYEDALLYIKQH